jgi:hypothetical protein
MLGRHKNKMQEVDIFLKNILHRNSLNESILLIFKGKEYCINAFAVSYSLTSEGKLKADRLSEDRVSDLVSLEEAMRFYDIDRFPEWKNKSDSFVKFVSTRNLIEFTILCVFKEPTSIEEAKLYQKGWFKGLAYKRETKILKDLVNFDDLDSVDINLLTRIREHFYDVFQLKCFSIELRKSIIDLEEGSFLISEEEMIKIHEYLRKK